MADETGKPKLTLKNAAALVEGDTTFPYQFYQKEACVNSTGYDYQSVQLLSADAVKALDEIDPGYLQDVGELGEVGARVVQRLIPPAADNRPAMLRIADVLQGMGKADIEAALEMTHSDLVLITKLRLKLLTVVSTFGTPEQAKPTEDHVRVLRVIEYTGPRALVEKQIARSVHGTRDFGNGAQITAVTLNEFPEAIEKAKDMRWTCPSCDALGFEPKIGYRASGAAFQGCDFCAQEADKDRARRKALDTAPAPVAQSAPSTLDLDTLTFEHAKPMNKPTAAAAEVPDAQAADSIDATGF